MPDSIVIPQILHEFLGHSVVRTIADYEFKAGVRIVGLWEALPKLNHLNS